MTFSWQPGPQHQFLSSPADIAIIGGGNDGGKTFALLLDASRHSENPNFGAVYFRRETPQIAHEGGLWDEATKMFGRACKAVTSPAHKLTFRSGAKITFSHMQHVADRFDWDGAQIPGIYFDQLEQFEAEQFWHLLGRNRSGCGVKPYIRASCNPKPDCWLSQLLQWWWNPETGYAIKERSGVIRWFIRDDTGAILWYDREKDIPKSLRYVTTRDGEQIDRAKSITFILALIDDNKIALKNDPQRLANLMNLPYVERERRRYGNWKIKDIVGDGLFKPEWWKMLPVDVWNAICKNPTENFKWGRGWDPAGGQSKGSDFSSGGLVGISKDPKKDPRVIIGNITRGQWSPKVRNDMMRSVLEKDKAFEALTYYWRSRTPDMNTNVADALGGEAWGITERGRKFFRAQPLAVQAEAGNVWLAPGDWNTDFIIEASLFKDEDSDDVRKDDQIDGVVLPYSQLTKW